LLNLIQNNLTEQLNANRGTFGMQQLCIAKHRLHNLIFTGMEADSADGDMEKRRMKSRI
jgi:hypothetical protein